MRNALMVQARQERLLVATMGSAGTWHVGFLVPAQQRRTGVEEGAFARAPEEFVIGCLGLHDSSSPGSFLAMPLYHFTPSSGRGDAALGSCRRKQNLP